MLRFSYGLSVAVIAAAVADPLVEFASNRGWFGTGDFTDHSNLDVVPALFVGLVLTALYVVLKYRSLRVNEATPPGIWKQLERSVGNDWLPIVPGAFVAQISVLYVMETGEQYAIWGHALGGALWLGGPAVLSILIHAAACIGTAFVAARLIRLLARTTLFVLRIVRAIATLRANPPCIVRRAPRARAFNVHAPLLCRIGERAPPLLVA